MNVDITFGGFDHGIPKFYINPSGFGSSIRPIKADFPNEFDFFNEWCGKDPINAKQYYEITR